MIYDPITRQSVTLLGRFPVQDHAYKFGQKVKGTYRYAKARYGEHLPGFSGGFAVGTEREVEINCLVADDGAREIQKAYDAAPALPEVKVVSCGCCSNGCVCQNHQDVPMGRPPHKCELHA